MLKTIKKIFSIPDTPKYLPTDMFSEPGVYTWEDWHKEVKIKYPIRYFMYYTLSQFFRRNIINKISDFIWYIKYHTYLRYHILDLRQPKEYKCGYLDYDFRMLYACFNILNEYIKESRNCWGKYSIDDISKLKKEIDECDVEDTRAIMQRQLEHLEQIKAIYEYWTVQRPKLAKAEDDAAEKWNNYRKKYGISDFRTQEAWKDTLDAQNAYSSAEDNALLELIKVRRGLWV